MAVQITSEKKVTIEDIVQEANLIWNKRLASGIECKDLDGVMRLMKYLQSEHKEFCTSYHIVAQYMCQMMAYHPRALAIYLEELQTRPWHTEEEYLDSQASYSAHLYQVMHPTAKKHSVDKFRKEIRDKLGADHENFKEITRAAEANVEAKEHELEQKNRDEMKKYFEWIKAVGEDGTVPLSVAAEK